ncbi:TetR/AcrR family transcriptional regulator [Devosia sp. 2618]|uniref:TetR/AcrR family transcriptional regulator n=1 Tax=Devosia sp. 2618 TaxID=3156454 RepID=UPI003397C265
MSDTDFAPSAPALPKALTKRAAIIDAAKRAFVRDGFAGISIDAIAIEAGVSRQTVYNQLGDKDQLLVAVVEDVSARSSALLMAVIATFPDKPDDIEAALIDFGVRLVGRCMCDIDGRALAMLMEREAKRYPEFYATWKAYGPGQDWPVIAACFDKLARNGYLDIDDASLATRQFVALINADVRLDAGPCQPPSDHSLREASTAGVKTFLRAFGARQR